MFTATSAKRWWPCTPPWPPTATEKNVRHAASRLPHSLALFVYRALSSVDLSDPLALPTLFDSNVHRHLGQDVLAAHASLAAHGH